MQTQIQNTIEDSVTGFRSFEARGVGKNRPYTLESITNTDSSMIERLRLDDSLLRMDFKDGKPEARKYRREQLFGRYIVLPSQYIKAKLG